MPRSAVSPLALAAALVLPVLALACARQADDATTTAAPASEAPAIEWHDFEPSTFADAAARNRIIVVDVGMEGCTACRWMDEKTYANPEVIARINAEFVAITVDAEARPDIGERYEQWAWPATIFMTPAGEQVLAVRGNKLPHNFIPILDTLIKAHHEGTLVADGSAPISVPPNPDSSDLGALRSRVVGQLDGFYNVEGGGFSARMKFPLGVHVGHSLLRAHARQSPEWKRRAFETLDSYAELIDPVWGGVFVAQLLQPERRLIPEKRIAGQAAMLSAWSQAYQLSRRPADLRNAQQVDRYVQAFLLSDDGGFFTSQEDDAPGLPNGVGALQYYEEYDDKGRREFGVPPIDHAIYTDKNALAIAAYVDLFEAGEDQASLVVAQRAAALMLARQGDDGLFAQHGDRQSLRDDDRMRPLPGGERRYLRPQGPMGLALLDLYRVTADAVWLEAAERLAEGLTHLQDPQHGGWFASDDHSDDAIIGRRKPVEGNAMAAQFLFELGVLKGDEDLRRQALRGLRAVSAPAAVKGEGRLIARLAHALEWMATGAVEVSVLGAPDDPRTQALYTAARRAYEPRKVLHHQEPGRYPDAGHPVAYVCSDEACSQPIAEPDAVAAEIAKFAGNRRE